MGMAQQQPIQCRFNAKKSLENPPGCFSFDAEEPHQQPRWARLPGRLTGVKSKLVTNTTVTDRAHQAARTRSFDGASR